MNKWSFKPKTVYSAIFVAA